MNIRHPGQLKKMKVLGTVLELPAKGPFIYYVITFLGFLDPPPPLGKHVFSTENNQKLAFSDPPPPLQVIT